MISEKENFPISSEIFTDINSVFQKIRFETDPIALSKEDLEKTPKTLYGYSLESRYRL